MYLGPPFFQGLGWQWIWLILQNLHMFAHLPFVCTPSPCPRFSTYEWKWTWLHQGVADKSNYCSIWHGRTDYWDCVYSCSSGKGAKQFWWNVYGCMHYFTRSFHPGSKLQVYKNFAHNLPLVSFWHSCKCDGSEETWDKLDGHLLMTFICDGCIVCTE